MATRREPPIQIKTPAQLAAMREAGLVVSHTLDALAKAVEPGITTADLDAIAAREIRAAGAAASFKGYHGYPATICTSVNDQIVHGIPSSDTVLAAGDLISIDCGAILGGWHGDAARTVAVGPVGEELAGLLRACERALWHGLAMARPGRRLTDISHAVEMSARASGKYGIVREYVGHGIGTEMHMDPPVPNYGRAGRGPVLAAGMTLAIEPMLVLGRPQPRLLVGPLRAHGGHHRGRALGADGRGRRPQRLRAAARRARRGACPGAPAAARVDRSRLVHRSRIVRRLTLGELRRTDGGRPEDPGLRRGQGPRRFAASRASRGGQADRRGIQRAAGQGLRPEDHG